MYIELPEDDKRKEGGRNVGKLLKAMYGLRDAPVVWHKMVNGMLLSRGFASSTTVGCMYANARSGVKIVAHVDDFLVTGEEQELLKLKKDLQKDFEVDGTLMGPRKNDEKQGQILGRIIRWKVSGL